MASAVLVASGLATSACDTELAPPFSFTGTGSLEGLVFFDVSEDGFFDPADGDTPLEGVALSARVRDTDDVFAGGETQTDASGRFTLVDLPLGTHDLRIDTLTVPPNVSICQNPVRFTISVDETRFQGVQARAACLITIAAAKELPLGEFVIVRGVLTSEPGQVEVRRTYIQDATAGTLLFDGVFASTLAGLGFATGDLIEVGGTSSQFGGDFQLVSVSLRDSVRAVGALTPEAVTTSVVAGIGGFDNLLQGKLLRIERARMTVAFGGSGLNERNALFDDGTGASQVRVDAGVVADPGQLNTVFTVGTCYSINGFGVSFSGAGQIFPRSLADVEEVSCN